MPKRIELTQGLFATVDDEDFEVLSKYKWHVKRACKGAKVYAARKRRSEDGPGSCKVLMHLQILGLHNSPTREDANWMEVDHINRDSLDNRQANLRYTNRQIQYANREPGWTANLRGPQGPRRRKTPPPPSPRPPGDAALDWGAVAATWQSAAHTTASGWPGIDWDEPGPPQRR